MTKDVFCLHLKYTQIFLITNNSPRTNNIYMYIHFFKIFWWKQYFCWISSSWLKENLSHDFSVVDSAIFLRWSHFIHLTWETLQSPPSKRRGPIFLWPGWKAKNYFTSGKPQFIDNISLFKYVLNHENWNEIYLDYSVNIYFDTFGETVI